MTEHLSEEQFARWVAGEKTAAGEDHVRECPRCREEIVRMETALRCFRATVRDWSAEKSRVVVRQANLEAAGRRGWLPRFGFRWPALAAAMLLLAVAPVYRTVRERDREKAAALARADAQLMEQVDQELSEKVPSPMQPLTQLVAWNEDSQSGTQSSSQKGEVQ